MAKGGKCNHEDDNMYEGTLMAEKRTETYDDVLVKAGVFGKYQLFVAAIATFIPAFTSGFITMHIAFTINIPKHWCLVPSADHLNLTHQEFLALTAPPDVWGNGYVCNKYNRDYTNWTRADVENFNASVSADALEAIKCDAGMGYDRSVYPSTTVTDWDLVCDRSHLVSLSSSIYMFGIMTGAFLAGLIADRWGRKIMTVGGLSLSIVASICMAVAPNYEFFTVARYLTSVGFASCYTSGYILAMEMIGPRWRPFIGSVVGYFWAGSLAVMPWIAYWVRAWRYVILACTAPGVLSVLLMFLLPESPRWLYSKNRHSEADAIVKKIAKYNGKELTSELRVAVTQSKANLTLMDILKQPKLRLWLLVLCYTWCCVAMVYYAILLNASRFKGDDFLNFSIGGLVEFAATIGASFALKFLPRRVNLCGCLLIAAISLLAILFTPIEMHGLMLTLVMIGRFCMTTAFFTIYVISAEIFPTVVRTVGISTCSVTARVGGMLAPFIGAMIEINRVIPFMTFGIVSLIGSVLVLILPETKDKRLPETLEDGELLGGFWCFSKKPKPDKYEEKVISCSTNI